MPAEQKILVRFDRVFGNVLCYPVNEAAKLFAELANTKTLSPRDVNIARKLGYRFEIAEGDYRATEWAKASPYTGAAKEFIQHCM